MIEPNIYNILFYWDGCISDSRLKILHDAVYSTRTYNYDRPIYVVSNSLTQDQFDPAFNIQVVPWDDSFFEDVPIPAEKVAKYKAANHREFSDLFRLVLLYKFGGTYVDTDDLAIKSLPNVRTQNIVCRSYDPHTCHYNKLTPADCLPGAHREIRGYDHLTIFPRNDCWVNFVSQSDFVYQMLTHPKFVAYDGVVYIGDDFSWQSLTLEVCKKNIEHIGKMFNLALTLLYLYEDFVAGSSYFDRCLEGGEMCDLYASIFEMHANDPEWGAYKCKRNIAMAFLDTVVAKYPYVSHMWLHSKDMKEEWLLGEFEGINDKLSPSTWILKHVRENISAYKAYHDLSTLHHV